jgi:hypothetical protein
MRDVVRAFPIHGLAIVLSVTFGAACAVSGDSGGGGTIVPTTKTHTDGGPGSGGSIDGGAPSPTPDPGTGAPTPDPGSADAGGSTPPDPGTADAGTSPPPSAAPPPTSCVDVGTKGCCSADGTTNYYCGTGVVKSKVCAAGTTCGWDATKSWYGCVTGSGGADPTGTYPLACGAGSSPPPATDAGTSPPPPATDAGTPTGTSKCAAAGTSCIDATGAGDYGCFAPGPAFPSGAKTCLSTTSCPTGYSCWSASAGATSGSCIQDCTTSTAPSPTPTPDAGTTGTDSGTTAKDSGTPPPADAGSTTCGAATVSFASTVFPALKSGCAGCHSQFSTAANAYKALTGSTGMGSACGKLVIPGNTSSSNIIGAVEGTGCTNMAYLSNSGITSLSTWICQGAKNN